MHLTHKIELIPSPVQRKALARACGCARFTWNWALENWVKQYKEGLHPTAFGLMKEFNVIKGEKYPFVYESPKDANQRPFINLEKAFRRFFKGHSKHPKFKKKGDKDSFYISNSQVLLEEYRVRLPVIGFVRLTESLRFDGKVLAYSIVRTSEKWHLYAVVDVGNYSKPRTSNGSVGIDLGLKTFVTLSDGSQALAPKPLKKNLNRLKRTSRGHSRKILGSKNREKSRKRLALLQHRISCIRQDFLHKLTTKICRENQTVIIEDLAVSNMLKNHKLAKALSDVSFSEFRRQLEYKSIVYSVNLLIAGRWFPSSKLCSRCGHKKETLKLSERTYICESCGFVCDRDLNAAINLKNLSTPGSGGIYAYGQDTPLRDLDEVGTQCPG